jgi:hypothetical protein
MRRHVVFRTILALALFTGTAGGAGPVAASPGGGCAGMGQMTLANGIAYPPNFSSLVGFTFTVNCATEGAVTGSGTFTSAACGTMSGTGSITGVGNFTIEVAGNALVVTGIGNNIVGSGSVIPIPDTSTVPPSNSCSNGTATHFLIWICIWWHIPTVGPGVLCIWL